MKPASPPPLPPSKKWLWLLGVLVAAGVVVYSPTLLAPVFLKDSPLRGKVSGTLFSPTLSGGELKLDGLEAKVGTARLGVRRIDPLKKTVHLSLHLKDAEATLRLQELLGKKEGQGGGSGGWKVILDELNVSDSRVFVDGSETAIPNLHVRVRSDGDDVLLLHGHTEEGWLSGRYEAAKGTEAARLSVRADARVLRHYWKGIEGGWLRAEYQLPTEGKELQGKVWLSRGVLVPEGAASFARITGVSGEVTHLGDNIDMVLYGQGLGSPIWARGSVDLAAQHWRIRAGATPSLAALGNGFGTTAEGTLDLAVAAEGWEKMSVRVHGSARKGQLAGVDVRGLALDYVFSGEGQGISSQRATLSATTLVSGEQALRASWQSDSHSSNSEQNTGQAQATWKGTLGGEPLALAATLQDDRVQVSGKALGGSVEGGVGTSGEGLSAVIHSRLGGVEAQARLSGSLSEVQAQLKGNAAGFPLDGTVTLGKGGVRADLDGLSVRLDKQGKGTWRAQGFSNGAVTLDGSGHLNTTGQLAGDVSVRSGVLAEALAGQLSIDAKEQQISFTGKKHRLAWKNSSLSVWTKELPLAGGSRLTADGTVALGASSPPRVTGAFSLAGGQFDVSARALGQSAVLSGRVLAPSGWQVLRGRANWMGGLTAALRLGELSLQARAQDDHIAATLQTGSDLSRWRIWNASDWDASGVINLAALRPLLPAAVAAEPWRGRAVLAFSRLGGRARVLGSWRDTSVDGTLTRQGGRYGVSLTGSDLPFSAGDLRLSGELYPRLSLSGKTPQILSSGVVIPSQPFSLASEKTGLRGTWGEWKMAQQQGGWQLVGAQSFSVSGKPARVSGRMTLGGAKESLDLHGNWDGVSVRAAGSLDNLSLRLQTAGGFQASGTASARRGTYDLRGGGRVMVGGEWLTLSGEVRGQGAQPVGWVRARGQGGVARLDMNGLQQFSLSSDGLVLAGHPLYGKVSVQEKVLRGFLRWNDASITAKNGTWQGKWQGGGHVVRLRGSAILSPDSALSAEVAGGVVRASGSGTWRRLGGTLQLKKQVAGAFILPSQSMNWTAVPLDGRAALGGLHWSGGRWSGSQGLAYEYGERGRLWLRGEGSGLSVQARGQTLSGDVALLPKPNGQLRASLKPWRGFLPDQMLKATELGDAWLSVKGDELSVNAVGTRYLGQNLEARANYTDGVWQGKLQHAGASLPFSYEKERLKMNGWLDGALLKPFWKEASGRMTVALNLPRDWRQGHGVMALTGGGSGGRVTLRGGKVAAEDLRIRWQDHRVAVSGNLYPKMDVEAGLFSLSETNSDSVKTALTGRISGDLSAKIPAFNMRAGGVWQGKQASLRATLNSKDGATISANLDSATLEARAWGKTSSLGNWKLDGALSIPDLSALAAGTGALHANLGGTLGKPSARISGQMAGNQFTLPLRWTGREIALQGGQAKVSGVGGIQFSGTIQPLGKLSGTLSGRLLTNSVAGVDVAGTTFQAGLSGKTWRLQTQGKVGATLRGQLGAGEWGGLTNIGLHLATTYAQSSEGASPTRLGLAGQLAWNRRTGWHGRAHVAGTVAGRSGLQSEWRGAGDLNINANWQGDKLSARLGRNFPLQPAGELTVRDWDVGALWGKSGQLTLTGAGQWQGSWRTLRGGWRGHLFDTAGELEGVLAGQFSSDRAGLRGQMTLAGERVAGKVTLDPSAPITAQLQSRNLHLARVLPEHLGLEALDVSGDYDLIYHGHHKQALHSIPPIQITAKRMKISGRQEQAGSFGLYGELGLVGNDWQARAYGTVGGGLLRLTGETSGAKGLQLTAEKVSWRGHQLDGNLRLQGTGNPTLSGTFNTIHALAEGQKVGTRTDVAGTLSQPVVSVRSDWQGKISGRLFGRLSGWNAGAREVNLGLTGTLNTPAGMVKTNLGGVWPRLDGALEIHPKTHGKQSLRPIQIQARGGSYEWHSEGLTNGKINLAARAGQPFSPSLSGTIGLYPLAWFGGSGASEANVTLGGSLTAPVVSGTATLSGTVSGVTVEGLRAQVQGSSSGFLASAEQGGREVASYGAAGWSVSGLQAQAGGVGWTLAASSSQSEADSEEAGQAIGFTARAAGVASGELRGTFRDGLLAVRGGLAGGGLNAAVAVSGHTGGSWRGHIDLSGAADGRLELSGLFASPLVTGSADVWGARAKVVAASSGVQLRLTDGTEAAASGAIELRPNESGEWQWHGATSLRRPELSVSVAPRGVVSETAATVSLRRGAWRGSGDVGLRGGRLTLTDGTNREGFIEWNKDYAATLKLPDLDLSLLDIEGVSGRLDAAGQFSAGAKDGTVAWKARDLTLPFKIPTLDIDLSGDMGGNIELRDGVPTLEARANIGSEQNGGVVQLRMTRPEKEWLGQLSGKFKNGAGGAASVDLSSRAQGLFGQVQVNEWAVKAGRVSSAISGKLALKGQTFDLAARTGGRASITASGSVADALPSLEKWLAVESGEGYQAQAVLDDFEVGRILPQVGGKVRGEVNLSDGGGTFFLEGAGVKVGEAVLPVRIDGTRLGTQQDSQWRLRGLLGESRFSGGLEGGELFGQAVLRGLPLGEMLAAVTGKSLGRGVMTGVAQLRLPLSDVAGGSAVVVGERITVSAGEGKSKETLTGSGTLSYANRELKNVDVQLSGAGTWDISGKYTREKVDVRALFRGTTFTPVFSLIPALAEQKASLRGSVQLGVAGTYDDPKVTLAANALEGKAAGLGVRVPQLHGELSDNGLFSVRGDVKTSGTLAARGQLSVQGQYREKLTGTRVTFTGSIIPAALGELPQAEVHLAQKDDRNAWMINASSQTVTSGVRGILNAQGEVWPRLDLDLTAQRYNFPMAFLFAKESDLNMGLKIREEGKNIRVSGAANFEKLLLGRVNKPKSTLEDSSKDSAVPYQSPLPLSATTFPPRKTDATEGQSTVSSPLLERIRLDGIEIGAPAGIRIDENLVRANWSTAGLTMTGSAASPRLSGQITAQRGSLFLRENEFSITKGEVDWLGDSLYPTFTIEAKGGVAGQGGRVDMTLAMKGSWRPSSAGGLQVLDLETTLRCSEPTCQNPATGLPYTEAELYALLATGVADLSQLPNNLEALGSSALQTALNVFVLGELERNLARALGLDVLRLTPTLSNGGDLNATFTVGSYVTRQLFLQYQVDLRGRGLVAATYTTPDQRFTFKAHTPLEGFDLQSVLPQFSAAYNVNEKASVSFGVQALPETTRFNFGLTYRIAR